MRFEADRHLFGGVHRKSEVTSARRGYSIPDRDVIVTTLGCVVSRPAHRLFTLTMRANLARWTAVRYRLKSSLAYPPQLAVVVFPYGVDGDSTTLAVAQICTDGKLEVVGNRLTSWLIEGGSRPAPPLIELLHDPP
jgi:hypothetical protein